MPVTQIHRCAWGGMMFAGWSRAELIRMNDDFVERVEHAIARGLERRPEEGKARAA